ncbi:MAG: hypothetical protein JNN27_13785 [Planctomycetes bacterium]|nr:hypothetical protein [Planctomycetota bacterium]
MTQSRHTPLGLRTQLVALANGIGSSDAKDYFANERTANQIGSLKAQLERDGFKDVAQQGAVALRIAEILQREEQIGPEKAHELLAMLVQSMATSLGIDLPVTAQPPAAAPSSSSDAKTERAPAAAPTPVPTGAGQTQLRMVSNRKLGELLVQMSLLTPTQVEQALAHQRMTGCRLGEALIQLKLLPKNTVESALRMQGSRRNFSGDPWRRVS